MKKYLYILLFFSSFVSAQITPNNPSIYNVCDDNNDGFAIFDLPSKDAEILGTLSPNLYTVSYHSNYSNAQTGTSPLSNQYQNTASSQQFVYPRVQENANTSNYGTTLLTLRVKSIPLVPTAALPYIAVYENPSDGIAVFDLSSQNSLFIGGQTDINITYHLSQNDAQNQVNPISNTSSYTGTDLQNIWMHLLNTTTGCSSVASFQLRVLNSDSVINFPDVRFRDKLLSASASNTIALNSSGIAVKIDNNNDGAIQFSEALTISKLNVSNVNLGAKISSIEGVQFFSNITNLDCSDNILSTINETYLTNLTKLNCGYNPLNTLNLPILPNLTELYCQSNNLSNLNFVNSSSLLRLDCFNNSIQSLNLNLIPNTVSLFCAYNQIQNLDLSLIPNLVYLDCHQNLLSSLNVEQAPNLTYLECSTNNITSLNLTASLGLTSINCDNNLITSLNLSNLDNLTNFRCRYNQITNLVLGSLNSITQFDCQNNLLSVFDASNVNKLGNYYVTCSNNPNLTQAFLKNYSNSGYFWFSACPNLQYICSSDQSISYYEDLMLTYNQPNVVVNSYCSFTPGGNYNTITGAMIFDANTNGCDALDLPQPNIKININDGTVQGTTFSNNSGNYNFFIEAGSFVVTPSVENPAWFTFSPTSITVPFANDNDNVVTQNFCISANGIHPDLEIVIAPIVPARPGFDAVYQIVYKNKGNQTLSQLYGVNFFYNQNLMNFVSATSTPSTVGSGSLSWSYANLLPFESRSIYVTLNINTPTDATNPVNIGDILQFTTSILPMAGDESTVDNTVIFNQTVVGSFDPNDITCIEGAAVSPSEIGNYLHYVINFENTGTYEAENIVVQTEINIADFDVNSLQMLNTSHNAYIRINGNIAEFVFENIMLDTGGHGNVLLKIRSKGNLVSGDIVSKRADIFFDYNAPIDTGMANTTFQTLLNNPEFENDNSISVYPNPTNAVVNIKSDFNINSIQLYDVQGRIVQTKLQNGTEITFDIADKSNGIYFLKITSDKGIKIEKLVKK